MSARIRSMTGRVGVAVLCVSVALLLQMPFWLIFRTFPYVTLFPAVLVAGYFGGRLSGLIATARRSRQFFRPAAFRRAISWSMSSAQASLSSIRSGQGR
jgi:hypothetical protein